MEYSDRFYVYLGCCRFHVESVAYAIAVTGIVLSFFDALFIAPPRISTASATAHFVYLALCLGVILAQRYRKPILYLPFIFVMALVGVATTFFACLFAFAPLILTYTADDSPSDIESVLLLLVALVHAIVSALIACQLRVVYRAREYMKLHARLPYYII